MWWSSLKWIVLGITLSMLGSNADPSPRNEDMYRELMKLDQLYSSIARPSLRSIPMTPEVGQKVQRALNMLRLQELDNLYSPRSRPRFGKRGEKNDAPNRNNLMSLEMYDNKVQYPRNEDEGSEPDWLPLRR